ncbi:MAG: hypothetical protein ACYCWW_16450 [Deltaproteobacteria bacterium]
MGVGVVGRRLQSVCVALWAAGLSPAAQRAFAGEGGAPVVIRAAALGQGYDLRVTTWSGSQRCVLPDQGDRPCRLRLDPGVATVELTSASPPWTLLIPNRGGEIVVDYDREWGMKLAGLLELGLGGLGAAAVAAGLQGGLPCSGHDGRCSDLLIDSGFFAAVLGLGLGVPTTILGFTLAGPRATVHELPVASGARAAPDF